MKVAVEQEVKVEAKVFFDDIFAYNFDLIRTVS